MNDAVFERERDGYLLSTDRTRIDVAAVHAFLGASYWAAGIPREVVERAIENSLAFGVYEGERQVGFARVITDRATYAYLSDVFILESHRGRGLGDWLVGCIREHPDLQALRRFALFTRDAATLYARHGFAVPEGKRTYMEILDRDVYRRDVSGRD
jgi:GNAT superfamily N-acetyltransferase